LKWPISNPKPDFSRLEKALLRKGEPDRVPFVEFAVDCEIMEVLLGEKVLRPEAGNREEEKHYIDQQIRFFYLYGYDYVPLRVDPAMPRKRAKTKDTATLPRLEREWVDQSVSLIANREEFEAYPWPELGKIDYFSFEYAARKLPSGMKITPRCSGVLEWSMWLMGYENFAYALVDDPKLIEMVVNKIGNHLWHIYQNLIDMEKVGALWISDDMGHKTGTLISPDHLRQYILPWHKKIADTIHSKDLPVILHSCGNLKSIMNDLINDVRIDAKHSYEDTFLTVIEAKKKYGVKICILGGVDVDVLTRAEEDELRKYVRRIIRECAPGGGYCLGSGNSVTNYVKVENYLAMLEEGLGYGKYPIGS